MTAAGVSVIVPTLNAAQTIDETLQSVLTEAASVSQRVEVTVIDGGSTDGTIDRVATVHHEVRLVTQESKGLAAARNEAIAQATGPLVAFCDADDIWTAGSLRLRLSALERNPSAWGVTGRVRFVTRDGYSRARPSRRRAGEEHDGQTPGALLIRRYVFDQVTFDPYFSIASDADWLIRARHLFGPPVHLDDVVLEKGTRSGSLSTDVHRYRSEMMEVARRFVNEVRGTEQR